MGCGLKIPPIILLRFDPGFVAVFGLNRWLLLFLQNPRWRKKIQDGGPTLKTIDFSGLLPTGVFKNFITNFFEHLGWKKIWEGKEHFDLSFLIVDAVYWNNDC